MKMAEAGEASGAIGAMSGNSTRMSTMAASELWDHINIGKRLRSETSESASALGDRGSQMQRTITQQVCKVTQLHHTVTRMARML